jgi:hypothetical protein
METESSSDPYSMFSFAKRWSSKTRQNHTRRLKIFFDFTNINNASITGDSKHSVIKENIIMAESLAMLSNNSFKSKYRNNYFSNKNWLETL